MSSSSSSSSSKSHQHQHRHHTAGQSPTISVDEYLSRCFQAIDDLADNPYLNGTLQSPDDDDGPVHMGPAASRSSSSKHSQGKQALRSHATTPVPKSVRVAQAAGAQSVEAQERVPLVGGSSSSSSSSSSGSSKGEGGAAKGLKRAFKRPSLFR